MTEITSEAFKAWKVYAASEDYKYHSKGAFIDGWESRESEIQVLRVQLGKCLIQENETLAIAAAHGWEYDPDNYTDEKAMKAYREWEARP